MLFNKKTQLIVSFLLIVNLLHAQTNNSLDTFIQWIDNDGAAFSFLLYDIEKEEPVYDYQTKMQLTPASVLKLLTTATALNILGSDFRFETKLAYRGEIKEGILYGDLIILGSGDPSLGSKYLQENSDAFLTTWYQALQQAGIQSVNGALIGDGSCLDEIGVSSKWLYEDLGSYYGAGSYGLNVFDNNYQVYLNSFAPNSTPTIVGMKPKIADFVFHNKITTQNRTSDSTIILGMPFQNERHLYGEVSANKKQITLTGDIPDPTLFLATYTQDYFKRKGIQFTKKATTTRLSTEHILPNKILATTFSPPLTELIRITNEVSQNLYADALLKRIGRADTTQPLKQLNAFEQGIATLKNHWKEKGIDVSSLCIYDGSGLALPNKLSAQLMNNILVAMHPMHSGDSTFFKTLPLAGSEGTVRNLLKNNKLNGDIRLKSGSMTRVKGYAGYVFINQKAYTLVLIVNNYNGTGKEITQKIDTLLQNILKIDN